MKGVASIDPDLIPKAGGLSPEADRIGDYEFLLGSQELFSFFALVVLGRLEDPIAASPYSP